MKPAEQHKVGFEMEIFAIEYKKVFKQSKTLINKTKVNLRLKVA